MRLTSSRLQVVSCIPRCVPGQTPAILHGELRRLDILPCNQHFKVCFTDVDVAGPFVAAVICYGRSRFNACQLWDDQRRFKQICRNIAWVRLPRRSTDILQQSVIVSLLFLDSSHGSNNMCPSLVHDNALSCFLLEHPRTHLLTTPTPSYVECAFGSRRTHRSSAAQPFRAYLSNACRLCDRRAAHPFGRVGEDWNNARSTKPTADFETPTWFQTVAQGSL